MLPQCLRGEKNIRKDQDMWINGINNTPFVGFIILNELIKARQSGGW